MVEVSNKLWKSCPTSLLSQGNLGLLVYDCVQVTFVYAQGGRKLTGNLQCFDCPLLGEGVFLSG